jgi:membrane protein YdbS with pleckstrin-like domain
VTERPTPEPARRLAPEALGMFAVEALGVAAALAAAAIALALGVVGGTLGVVLCVLALAAAAAAVVLVPRVRLARFRFEVREDEIDLRRGIVVETRTLVPMARVQHVDMRRTALSRLFGLAAVVFHTAAGAHEIPALRDADAVAIRDQIADLARTPEVL